MNCNLSKNFSKQVCKKSVGEARFSLILPKKDNSNHPIKVRVIKKYIEKVNGIFGGSTTIPTTKGCYVDNGKLQCESGLEITGVLDFDSKYDKKLRKFNSTQRIARIKSDYAKLKKVAKEAGNELGQDSIMVVSDFINDASFVEGQWKKKINHSLIGKREIF